MLNASFTLSIVTALAAILFFFWDETYLAFQRGAISKVEQLIIDSWHVTIRPPNHHIKKVIVGVNTNLDLIISASELFTALETNLRDPQDHHILESIDDLQQTFGYFFEKGSAAERNFYANSPQFELVVSKAETLNRKEYYIGGNAALMAQKIATSFPYVEVTLVGPIGPKLKSLLHPNITVPAGSVVHHDEIHLIMEYQMNEELANVKAPRANRFITSSDKANGEMEMLGLFLDEGSTAKPDLIVLSGLNQLSVQESAVIEAKLSELERRLQQADGPSAPIHLELASMTNQNFLAAILERTLPLFTSLGMNEQEMLFLSHVGNGPHANLYETLIGPPPVRVAVDILEWLLLRAPAHPNHRLSRVHFHTLTYHIVAISKGGWTDSKSAVAKAAMTAGQQACDDDVINANNVEYRGSSKLEFSEKDVRDFDPGEAVVSHTRGNIEFIFSPVLVCKVPRKTVGLGDAISAMGLLYSKHHS